MKKKFLFLTMLLTLCAVGTMKAQNSITTVTTEAELIAAVQTNGANIQFANPISTTSLLEIKDSKTITIDAAPGVYILKLNDKVQKIIIR